MSGPMEPIDPNREQGGAPPPWTAPPQPWGGPQPGWVEPADPARAPADPVDVHERRRRFAERPLPLAGGSIAGAGVALVVLGVIVWAGDYAITGISGGLFDGGSTRNWLGVVLALLVVAAGYVLAATSRGPLATAGVAASALGVPTALSFMTLDATGGTPVNLNVVFVGSILVWLLSYRLMPGARGHSFYVGLSAVALWAYLIIKIEPNLFGLPLLAAQRAFAGPDAHLPDPTSHLSELAAMSLILGAGYYVIAFALDESGRRGAATPLALAGFPAVLGGILFAADSIKTVGVGVLLILIGAAVTTYGARARRRFTSWVWAAAMAVGVLLLVGKATSGNNAGAGVALVVIGAALVVVGVVVSSALSEREYPNL